MTDQQTDLLHHEDGYGADDRDLLDAHGDEYGETEIGYEDGSAFDEAFDDWDGAYIAPPHRPPPPDSRPWYRDPRWLFALIGLAAAALVVATVLLVTGRGSGEIPTSPGLTTRTPASTSNAPRPSSAPSSPPASSPPASSTPSSTTSTSSSPSPSEEPGAVDVPPPAEPSASAAAPPPAPPSQDKSPAGPRINVTRTPMSFSPGRN